MLVMVLKTITSVSQIDKDKENTFSKYYKYDQGYATFDQYDH